MWPPTSGYWVGVKNLVVREQQLKGTLLRILINKCSQRLNTQNIYYMLSLLGKWRRTPAFPVLLRGTFTCVLSWLLRCCQNDRPDAFPISAPTVWCTAVLGLRVVGAEMPPGKLKIDSNRPPNIFCLCLEPLANVSSIVAASTYSADVVLSLIHI